MRDAAFLQDIRYGFRALRRTPGFTIVAVIALGLGVGANTAIFSVVDAVLLRPLAYKNADRLVTVLFKDAGPVSVGNYFDWSEQSHSFETMAGADYWTPNLTNSDPPEHLWGLQVTQNLLPMLGVGPFLGRLFLPGEDRLGNEHEVILSYGLWERRFRLDRSVLGKAITLNGQAYIIVGVMPPGFKFAPFWATRAELWVPDVLDRTNKGDGRHLRIFARLKDGITLQQARAEMSAITARLERQDPGTNRGVVVTPLKENVVGKVETPLVILLAAVGFVLLIACANVAHMLLARTADRTREIAVRTALGASRTRVIRQFLTENLLLAAAGASLGLLLALWWTRGLVALGGAYLPRAEAIGVDGRAVLFLLAATIFTAALFGLAPAMHAAASNLSGALKAGGRTGTDGIERSRLRGFLVASEFALAFILLIGAGLMIRSFFALQSIDPGFDPHNVLSMVVSVAGSREAAAGPREAFYRQLLERTRSLPGVESASAINHLPLAGDEWGWSFSIEGRPKPRPGESPGAVYRIVMPGYFETMRLPLRRGRSITENDDSRAPGVVIINQRAADAYWPGENPIGKRISFSKGSWLTIVGVAADAKQSDWAARPAPEVYLAALQNADFLADPAAHFAYITLVVRTAQNPAGLISAIKQTVWSFDRNLPVSSVLTMDHVVVEANAEPRFEMLLLSMFGGVALLLAAIGIYGVMSYSVARRTHEIGIHMSLGASRTEVLRMVVRDGMAQALAGTAVGFAGALLLAQFLSRMLYGLRAADPLTFASVAILLLLTALAATCIPASKAARIEPMIALRTD